MDLPSSRTASSRLAIAARCTSSMAPVCLRLNRSSPLSWYFPYQYHRPSIPRGLVCERRLIVGGVRGCKAISDDSFLQGRKSSSRVLGSNEVSSNVPMATSSGRCLAPCGCETRPLRLSPSLTAAAPTSKHSALDAGQRNALGTFETLITLMEKSVSSVHVHLERDLLFTTSAPSHCPSGWSGFILYPGC